MESQEKKLDLTTQSSQLDLRSAEELNRALALAQHTVYKQYLDELSAYPLVEPSQRFLDEEPQKCVRAFKLTQLTCKKGEDSFQKLSTVYHAAMSLGCSLFVMVDVPGPAAPADIYLGLRSPDEQFGRLVSSYAALKEGLVSNFPGSQVPDVPPKELGGKLNEIFDGKAARCIAAVSCVASTRDKSRTEHKSFIQGIEKLIDVMRGKSYTALFIAEPVSPQEQSEIRGGYESLYSALSSFQKSVWSYNESESHSVMESLSRGISTTVTEGTSHTQSHTVTKTKGRSNTFGIGIGGNFAKTNGSTRPTAASRAGNIVGTVGGLALRFAAPLTAVNPILGGVAAGVGAASSIVGSGLQGSSITDSITKSLGLSGNYSHSRFKSTSEADGTADATMHNEAKGENTVTGESTTDTSSTGRTLQIENVNKAIDEMLKRIEEQLKRTREGEDYGAYSCGAYFLSNRQNISLLAANTYRALMLGEGSSVERSAVNLWGEEKKETEIVSAMKEYLRRFAQPVFALPLKENDDDVNIVDYLPYSPGTVVSGLELPLHMGLPTRSVMGLPVIDHAEFGRNVTRDSAALPLGCLYHMGQAEKNHTVGLDLQSLTGHVFLTGSTGAGKSNAVYHILDKLSERDISFLVVEPAKGEYKKVLGGREDVAVYGTNPRKTPLLRLNPFSFPAEVHILEHIDRLVEIFNACWPMYAAMPAVLKDAVEEAYRRKGWDLSASYSAYGEFPTFSDLLAEFPRVMERSAYSADTKNDYIGSLVTRVRSLTNGINGQIFRAAGELTNEELFDRNVIVDISRVGSTETKALLIGILVLKLQEYRETSGDMNAGLQHITVLEEAHNLLRRCSDVQTQESSNLQGKSVEMLANAIAEMRTYGESFLIADQAPGLLDPSVIRNTNTKIILRLPDETDRKLVGRAASLNDDQIGELSKLPLGVAAVYQNDWLEPVLCQFEKFDKEMPYEYKPASPDAGPLHRFYKMLFAVRDGGELSAEDVDTVGQWIDGLKTKTLETKPLLHRALEGNALTNENQGFLAYNLFEGNRLADLLENTFDEAEGIRRMDDQLFHMEGVREQALAERIRRLILQHVLTYDGMERFRSRFESHTAEGGLC